MHLATIATVASKGLTIGLLLTAFGLGFRHGIDWDHIAAITDITGSQEDRKRSLLFGTLYALGHAVVVFVIGVAAIVLGKNLPPSVDRVMGRVVGVTLIILGVYVVISLIRHGRDFRLRSRWMLVFAGVRKGTRWVRERSRAGAGAGGGEPGGGVATDTVEAPDWHHGHHGLPGHHHHQRPEPEDAFMSYGKRTAFVVGMIHGFGGETPTQVVLFATAAGAGAGATGVLVLAAFLLGLFTSNSAITLGSAFGYMSATRNFGVYAGVATVTAVFSLVVGSIFLLGGATALPSLFGG